MRSPEALILRRCYPVPVTVAEMRAAIRRSPPYDVVFLDDDAWSNHRDRADIHTALKDITGAIDEVYAVVDGREVRVATCNRHGDVHWLVDGAPVVATYDLLDEADRAGYWERPHEVRLDLAGLRDAEAGENGGGADVVARHGGDRERRDGDAILARRSEVS